MKPSSSRQLDGPPVNIATNHDWPRIQIRFAQLPLTMSELEVMDMARQRLGAASTELPAEELNNHRRNQA